MAKRTPKPSSGPAKDPTRHAASGPGDRARGTANAPDKPVTDIDAGDSAARSVLSLIRDVREGRTSGPMLLKEDRIRVVEHLTGEGYSGAEIAEILKVSERTVNRDRIAVRELNALMPSDEMVGQVVGHLVRTAEQVTGRLRRIGREAGAKPVERIEAEKVVWQVQRELVVTLQGLGYLPTAPTSVHARVTTGDDLPQAEALLAEIDRIESLPELRAADGTPMVAPGLSDLRGILARSIVVERLNSMACGDTAEPGSGSGGVSGGGVRRGRGGRGGGDVEDVGDVTDVAGGPCS